MLVLASAAILRCISRPLRASSLRWQGASHTSTLVTLMGLSPKEKPSKVRDLRAAGSLLRILSSKPPMTAFCMAALIFGHSLSVIASTQPRELLFATCTRGRMSERDSALACIHGSGPASVSSSALRLLSWGVSGAPVRELPEGCAESRSGDAVLAEAERGCQPLQGRRSSTSSRSPLGRRTCLLDRRFSGSVLQLVLEAARRGRACVLGCGPGLDGS
mmetsp:Transcript_105829/g.331749  ORF Transcript_105829/g.331749 Transcript_105829/m.331749 type:complete len:218 (+) Transcript_105829:550-1203(+)